MRWMTRCAALALGLAGGSARAQPAGDPTPGSQAPLVVLVNPMDGAMVGPVLRVQARVQHPAGAGEVSAVTVEISGAGGATLSLARNPRYALGAEQAVYEGRATLAVGGHVLVATATDGSGRSTRSAPVAVEARAFPGDGRLLVTDDSSQLCSACHGVADHGAEAAGRSYGAWSTTCRDCHTPHSTRNASLIRESVRPPWFAGGEAPPPREVRFSTRAGFSEAGGIANPSAASFANGDGSGLCQVCHTRTSRWQAGGEGDAVHRGNCTFCHRHTSGLKVGCADCHPVPPVSGAHAAHQGASAPAPPFPGDPRPLGCGSCHPRDPARHGDGTTQVQLNAALVLPGGTETAGAVLSGRGLGSTCLVACHFPMGAPAPASPVAWSATGPLPCTSCHARIDPIGIPATPRAGPSFHAPGFSEARPASGEATTCYSCHDAGAHDSTHLTGAPGLVAAGAVNSTCIACHAPPAGPAGDPGQVLHQGTDASTSRTPPILPGWTEATVDAASGDFHGGRRGTCFDAAAGPVPCAPAATPTGYGGTLKAPYTRGYPAMPCATCHAGHASRNAFLFAESVNGVAIPAGSIDRAGVGAERLCEACHEGARHGRCVACHTDTYSCESGQCWMDGGATHVDPAPPGSACFFCHGHEGILRWTQPGPDMDFPWDETCTHCHSGWAPGDNPPTAVPPSYAAPKLTSGPPSVSAISSSGATITWRTDALASTWVEYGVGMPGFVTGSAAEVQVHTVALSGLTPGTTYVWRIRSVDAFRNVLRSAVSSFTTPSLDTPAPLDVLPVGWTGVETVTSMVQALQWYEVAGPGGHPLEYRVQLGSDPTFTWLVNGAPADSGWVAGISSTWGGKPIRYVQVSLTNLPADDCVTEPIPSNSYFWRVKARDAVTGIESVWSVIDPFDATSWDAGHCGY